MNSRTKKGRRIARVVSEQIAKVTSPGLGGWDLAWEFVAVPVVLIRSTADIRAAPRRPDLCVVRVALTEQVGAACVGWRCTWVRARSGTIGPGLRET